MTLSSKLMKRQKGFSLIEVLVGLVCLAVGLLALGGLQVAAIRGTSSSHHLTRAAYLAHDGLEFLENLPRTDERLTADKHSLPAVNASGVIFEREYVVTLDEGFRRIRYIVRWHDKIDHSVSFATIRE